MKGLRSLLDAGMQGGWGLKKLNMALKIGIPFNRPHGIKIHKLEQHKSQTFIPYKKKNFNHIRGTHACGLATVSEFSAGLLLMNNLNADEYRIIMKTINVEYHYQCKKDAIATSEMSESEIMDSIKTPLESQEAIMKEVVTEIYDVDNNHISTCKTLWQIKSWSKVKTKL